MSSLRCSDQVLDNSVIMISALAVIASVSLTLPNLMRLVTATAYVTGMSMVTKSIFELKQFGEQRTMYSREASFRGPLIYGALGTLLLYLPTSIQLFQHSFWTDPLPYSYLAIQTNYAPLLHLMFGIIQLLGTIALIRGILVLKSLSHGGQPGEFQKGITHLIGGVFCLNIYQVVQAVLITLGIAN